MDTTTDVRITSWGARRVTDSGALRIAEMADLRIDDLPPSPVPYPTNALVESVIPS